MVVPWAHGCLEESRGSRRWRAAHVGCVPAKDQLCIFASILLPLAACYKPSGCTGQYHVLRATALINTPHIFRGRRAVQKKRPSGSANPPAKMAERCSGPSDGDGDDTNAQRAKRRRAAPAPSDGAIDAADLRLLESLPRELGLREFRFLARGHKGVVYVANYSCAGRTGRVAIKICRDGGARQEERWLRRCNELGIGASLVSYEWKDCVAMEYVEGPSIGEALDGAVPPGVLFKALRDLLGQCARLDERGIDKREMNRCQKHVIVSREGKSTLLDFERCQESAKPSNVTGLAQYLTQAWAVGKLRGAGAAVDIDAVRAACKSHKKAPSPKTVEAIEEALGLPA